MENCPRQLAMQSCALCLYVKKIKKRFVQIMIKPTVLGYTMDTSNVLCIVLNGTHEMQVQPRNDAETEIQQLDGE